MRITYIDPPVNEMQSLTTRQISHNFEKEHIVEPCKFLFKIGALPAGFRATLSFKL